MIPKTWCNRRFLVLFAAFMLLVITPLLNFYAHWTFLQGWYQSFGIGDLWIVSPLEGLESLLITRSPFGPLLVSVLPPVILALALGRVFCSWACPISFLSELSDRITGLFRRKGPRKDRWQLAKKVLWVALGLELAVSLVLGAPIFVFLSPPGLVGRELMMWVFFRTLAIEGIIIVVVLLLNLITRRFYCRYLCPLGGLLALIGRWRALKVTKTDHDLAHCGQCDRSCPMGLEPSQGESEGVYCWNCGTCVDVCPHSSLQFQWDQHSRTG